MKKKESELKAKIEDAKKKEDELKQVGLVPSVHCHDWGCVSPLEQKLLLETPKVFC